MFGKTMSIPDELIANWFELCTDVPMERVKELTAEGKNPRDAKVELAKAIVALYHSEDAANEAERYFVETFSKRQTVTEAPEAAIPNDLGDLVSIPALVAQLGLAKSNGAAKDLMKAGAISLDEEKLSDAGIRVPRQDLVGKILRVGKHQYRKLV